MKPLLCSAALVAIPALAQPVGGGLLAGIPLSDAFRIGGEGFSAKKPSYTLGPFIEFRPTGRLGIEVGVLHEGLRFDYSFPRPGLAGEESSTTASTWQFPILLKYRFGSANVRPFLAGGVAAYRVGGVEQAGEVISQLPSQLRQSLSRVGNTFVNGGGVAGGGVELRIGGLRIAPQVRFTRWAVDKAVGTRDVSLRLNQSRAHVFVSVGF